MTVSGENPTSVPQTQTVPPQQPTAPDVVQLDRKEHDRLQAELRRAQKALKDKEEAEAEARRQAAQKAAEERGDFETALKEEQKERERLKAQLAERDKKDAVRDAIAGVGLVGTKANLVRRLVDLSLVTETDGVYDAQAAVQAVVDEYPDLFGTETSEEDPSQAEPTQRRVLRGAAPAVRRGAAPAAQHPAVPFEGYISPEEYAATPSAVRKTSKDFQQRVEASRPYWPKTISARDLPQAN